MPNDLLAHVYREREKLQAELARVPAWQKLQQLQKLIATYEAFEDVEEKPRASSEIPPSNANVVVNVQPQSRAGSKTALVNEVISRHLLDSGHRASSGDLLPIVQAAGIEIGGSIPAKTLSSFLTSSKLFNNVKGFGYGLVEWGNSLGPKAGLLQSAAKQSPSMSMLDEKNNSGVDGGHS
ncbi:hypothetical protein [Rhizobium sp. L43]|uniref:hypothetical protein n=1 Tax=Rhizobium sp. L43 TaxID=2035452 RepID=UPI000BEAB030|nr:hypothetical protein [Rhizobium sp. L43]PDS78511.1 hypothetical protein CO667_12525 [Rhizobium sp. L43]